MLLILKKQEKCFTINSIVFSQHSLCLIPEIFNTIDIIFTDTKLFRMIDSFMLKVSNIEYVIASITICIDHAIGCNFPSNNTH